MTRIQYDKSLNSLHRAPRAQYFASRILCNELLILGVTDQGRLFDAPDWQHRLCGLLATQQEGNRLRYSAYLRPIHVNGIPAVVMSCCLQHDNPESFAFVQQFITENQLRTRPYLKGATAEEYSEFKRDFRKYIKC
ncbi:MAG: DUF3579 domain-containing protein [Gallionella sp.]|nr:DUF3579 domain-containing protein [Gallionella sp.]